MASQSKTTQDHDEIRKWAEERGGQPSHVKSTGDSSDIGILRIDFPGYSGEDTLEQITWEEFFEKFDDRKLSLLYQEETAGGEKSNFNKLVSAETAEENEERSSPGHSVGRKKTAGRSSRGAKKVASPSAAAPVSKKTTAPAKKTVAKKAAAPVKKTAIKKAAVKKASVTKKATKKGPVKKAAKTVAKKTTPAAKKVAPKKGAPKKAAAKKVIAKKAAPKKAAAKKKAGRPVKKSAGKRR